LTDSVFSQQELSKCLGIQTDHFTVVPLGGDHMRDVLADDAILQKYALLRNSFLLSVASQSRHKNFARVLQAFKLIGSGFELVTVGGNYQKIFQKTENLAGNPAVHNLGYVNDHELKALYENALGFIFPSLYEGFGLPILEAMNCGCPVICSKTASIPEVAGKAALYFDPLNVEDMAQNIRMFLINQDLRSDMQTSGLKQAAAFSWDQAARTTLAELTACL
jgi:glycosyltransferase involved in cell wall biosynthesis